MKHLLVILNEIPVTVACEDCGETTIIENVIFQCKYCESTKVKLVTGNELKVTELEIND